MGATAEETVNPIGVELGIGLGISLPGQEIIWLPPQLPHSRSGKLPGGRT